MKNENEKLLLEENDAADARDYFGFDLGDGESAVAWLESESAGAPLMLEIAGKKSVLTALGRRGDAVVIGEQACLADVDELDVRFKSRYLSDPAGTGRLIRTFALGVLREIQKTGRMGADSQFFVGCPSGWRAQERESYKKLFVEAGFPGVEVISESRAAFLFMRESGELRISGSALNRSALVIDAGSSTTDFTYIRDLKVQNVFDFGQNHLGGGLIDRLLLRLCVDRHPLKERIDRIFKACPQYEARCELEARSVKEMFFNRKTQPTQGLYALPCESSIKLYYEDPPIRLDIVCDEKDMARILHTPLAELDGKCYMDAYRQSLVKAKEALREDGLELILLTGGASRMGFMASVARDVFPKAKLMAGAEPEFSIARGLCYALRIDRRTQRFEEDVKALANSNQIEAIVMDALPRLFGSVSEAVARQIVSDIAPAAFARWRRGEIRTMDEMSDAMRDHLADSAASGALKDRLETVTKDWLETIRPQLEKLTDPICARCHLPLTSLRLNSHVPMDASRLNLDAGSMVNLDLIQTVVDISAAAVVAMLLGGSGVALLMTGPIGLAVSFAVGFAASRLGTTLARRHMGKFDMPVFMRTLFTQSGFQKTLENRESAFTRSIDDKFRQMLDTSDPAVTGMIRQISEAIEGQLTGMAQQARLLIH